MFENCISDRYCGGILKFQNIKMFENVVVKKAMFRKLFSQLWKLDFGNFGIGRNVGIPTHDLFKTRISLKFKRLKVEVSEVEF